jgi:hypothetical protein
MTLYIAVMCWLIFNELVVLTMLPRAHKSRMRVNIANLLAGVDVNPDPHA